VHVVTSHVVSELQLGAPVRGEQHVLVALQSRTSAIGEVVESPIERDGSGGCARRLVQAQGIDNLGHCRGRDIDGHVHIGAPGRNW